MNPMSPTRSVYRIRPARLDDLQAIVHHRSAMFRDMGLPCDFPAIEREFGTWLPDAMRREIYFGWLAETDSAEIAAGGGLSVLPWPPGPRDLGHRIAYVYNVYTEPGHRRRGLARRIMETLHGFCRERGLRTVALHASDFGRPLYESMGYRPTNEMRIVFDPPADPAATA